MKKINNGIKLKYLLFDSLVCFLVFLDEVRLINYVNFCCFFFVYFHEENKNRKKVRARFVVAAHDDLS